jgi:tetratricopeptide (TPR) repeat protein
MEKKDKLSSLVIGIGVFLLPVFFIPSALFPFQYAKAALVTTTALVALILWFVARMKDNSFAFPWHPAFFGLLSIPLAMLISALASGHAYVSLLGSGYEAGTVSFISLAAVLTVIFSEVYRSSSRIAYAYIAFIAGFFFVALFQALRFIFGADFLILHNFFDAAANLIGRWNDLVIYSGAVLLLSLVSLELLSPSKLSKALLYAAIIIAFFFVGLANFSINIYFFDLPFAALLGIFGLIFFAYLHSYRDKTSATRHPFPKASLLVVILGVIFTLASAQIGGALSGYLSLVQIDARPSWQATGQIASATYKEGAREAFLGVGPNRFVSEWLLHKPDVANQSLFWNIDFASSVGFIPTFLVTGGLLGILSWLVFLVSFVLLVIKALFTKYPDRLALFLVLSSASVSTYFWLMNIFYIPSIVNLTMAFVFTGLFFAVVIKEKVISVKTFSPFKTPQLSFISMVCLVVFLIGTIGWAYAYESKMVAVLKVSEGLQSISNNAVDQADQFLLEAANLSPKDDYIYRYLSQTALQKMSDVVSAKNLTTDAQKAQLQNILSASINRAAQAVKVDSSNYQNWIALGDVYFQAKTMLGITEAYAQAKQAYDQALVLNPKNPALYLASARLEAANNNLSGAKDDVLKALNLKPDYLDAISFISQLQTSQGDTAGALALLERAIALDPNDPQLYFQIGVLRYSLGQYQGAEGAFSQALSLTPQYANAKYYLAISKYNLGKTPEALALLNELLKDNPESADLQNTIANIQKGRSALAAPEPVTSAPSPKPTPKPTVKKK